MADFDWTWPKQIDRDADLPFQIVSCRYEKRSVVLTPT
jgi:hypothetical protein